VGRPHTVVHASGLSANAVVEALRRGRSYLVESAGVSLDVTAMAGEATAGPGEELAVPAGDGVDVAATVTGAPGSKLVIRTAAGVVASTAVDSGGSGTLRWPGCGVADRFLRVEVRRPRSRAGVLTSMVAMSNPIWLCDGESR